MQLLSQQGARCILLTSGTLSPISALVSELGINIPVTLENGHVVTGDQLFVSVVSSGPDGTSLNSSYNTRSVTN
jgi:hydroxymethylpyrimidine pyrophosphatase-like HAD family hydrolase